MQRVLRLFLYGTKSGGNNGPNGHPAQCMTPSEFYKIRFKQTYWKVTNWILCLYVSVVVRRFATGDAFVYLQ